MGVRYTRINVSLTCTYYLQGSEANGTIVDISSGGIGIEVKQILVAGDILRIKFNTPDQNVIDFWGIVRNVTGNFIGVKYEEISNENRERIEHLVNDLLKTRGLASRESF